MMKEKSIIHKPKVSIVTVCYNSEDLIEETIKSVIHQTYDNIEYIIIDGASTDGTVEIIQKYSSKIHKWISEPDNGIYDAMNKGILLAAGEYINFMNVGDVFSHIDSVSNIIRYLDGSNTIVSGCYNKLYKDGRLKKMYPQDIKNFETYMPICHQATFTNLKYHKDNLFDCRIKYSADYNFYYKAYKRGINFKLVDEVVANFRVGEGASAENFKASILERQMAWEDNEKSCIRRLVLWYYIYKIMLIRILKKYLK